uniref:NifT protein n=1 Tax=Stutzerimonas stutzeri TaxID=316 RepID=Q93JU8_STUST|nr:NifT protein [Stutzerimonas stutzeri]
MPSVMISRNKEWPSWPSTLAKKDQEEIVVSLEHDSPERWGGEFALADGSSYYLEPLWAPPKLTITLRAKRAGEG